MKNICNLLILLLLLAASACQSGKKEGLNLRPYYYPIETLRDGKVYEYVTMDSTAQHFYWYFIVVKDEKGNEFLVSSGYNEHREQDQLSREQLTPDGAITVDYRFYAKDSLGQTHTFVSEIKESASFPWQPVQSDSLAYRFDIRYREPMDSTVRTTLVKDRYYLGLDEYDYFGKKLKCVVYKVKGFMELQDPVKGGDWKNEFTGKEIYAEGLGLVYAKMEAGGQTIREYKLVRTMPMDEFIEKGH